MSISDLLYYLLKAKKSYRDAAGVNPTHITMNTKTKRELAAILESEGMSFKHPDYFEDHIFGMQIMVDDDAPEVYLTMGEIAKGDNK